MLALVLQVQHAGVDGEVALVFFLVVIGDAGAVVDAAAAIDRLGLEEQGVGKRGLAGDFMPDQGEVADVIDLILAMNAPGEVLNRSSLALVRRALVNQQEATRTFGEDQFDFPETCATTSRKFNCPS